MTETHARLPRRKVDGVLLLDKPIGLSSNAVLQRAKRLYAAEKAGHTGTLDPLASGLLPICFGEATKFAQALLDARKTYVATVRFGIATTTGDAEGERGAENPVDFGRADLERALSQFVGAITQVPPRHAALKFEGRNYYEYARAGIEIPRPSRHVEIDAIDLIEWVPPMATLNVVCSKGTYIRVLAEDLGAILRCGAHLAGLIRTATGPFALDRAVTLDALEAMDVVERDALLLPVHAPLLEMQALNVGADIARALCQGQVAPVPAGAAGRYCCFDTEGAFLGMVDVDAGGMRAVRLVRTPAARA
ncbi:MAG: tRNA pseudouridine(55) synthase TruB [Vicinamibacterales bacterium]